MEPDRESQSKIGQIYKELKYLFQNTSEKTWKQQINPHMTIAQPVDRKSIAKNYSEETLKEIKNEHLTADSFATFTIDSIYWIKRTETTPFQIEFAFPLGNRYPSTLINLDLSYLSSENNILNYMYKKNAILSIESDQKLANNHSTVLSLISKSLCSIEDINQNKLKSNQNIYMETSPPNYNALVTIGSFQHGIISNDLDFSLIHFHNSNTDDEFKKRLTYELAKEDTIIHVARYIPEAKVPIIDLCLKSIENADLQIHYLNDCSFRDYDNIFYDNYEFMLKQNTKDYNKLYPISGVFEVMNMKKFIRYFKDYQIVLSFVKHWAKSRDLYGKAFGYLGGISWSILVVFYLDKSFEQNKQIYDLDLTSHVRYFKLIKGFFKFYSNWNWNNPISLYDYDYVKMSTQQYEHQIKKTAINILQTVYPYHNTSKNVNDSTRKLIMNELNRAQCLFEMINDMNYKIMDEINLQLDLYSIEKLNHIKFNIYFDSNDDLNHLFTLIKAKTQGLITHINRLLPDFENIRAYPRLFELQSNKMNQACFLISLNNEFNKSKTNTNNDNIKKQLEDICANFINDIKLLSHISNYSINSYVNIFFD